MLLKLAISIALAHSISPKLFTAIVMQESSFRNGIVSETGDLGLGQLRPRTAASVGCVDNYRLRWDARYNLTCSARYLQYLYGKYGNTEPATWWNRYNSSHPKTREQYGTKVRQRMREMYEAKNRLDTRTNISHGLFTCNEHRKCRIPNSFNAKISNGRSSSYFAK